MHWTKAERWTTWSPSSRRAWIEIFRCGIFRRRTGVALLAEGVDRNQKPLDKIEITQATGKTYTVKVALLAEGVDRNSLAASCSHIASSVALLAEGVDRNFLAPCPLPMMDRSPSSRRAWIEI